MSLCNTKRNPFFLFFSSHATDPLKKSLLFFFSLQGCLDYQLLNCDNNNRKLKYLIIENILQRHLIHFNVQLSSILQSKYQGDSDLNQPDFLFE